MGEGYHHHKMGMKMRGWYGKEPYEGTCGCCGRPMSEHPGMSERGGMGGGMGMGGGRGDWSCGPMSRHFPTKAEQVEMLNAYKEHLQEHLDDVNKRLAEFGEPTQSPPPPPQQQPPM